MGGEISNHLKELKSQFGLALDLLELSRRGMKIFWILEGEGLDRL